MPWEKFRDHILPYFTRDLSHQKEVGLYMMGEPLLHPEYFTIQRAIRRARPDMKIEIATNGTRFTPAVVERLVLDPPDYMICDVTPWKESPDAMRRVSISVAHTAAILAHRWPATVAAECKRDGRQLPQIAIQLVQRTDHPVQFPLTMLDLANRYPDRILLKEKFLDSWAGQLPDMISISSVQPPETRTCCEEPFRRVAVTVDGDVVPCCRDAHASIKYGNLFSGDSLETIWNGPVAEMVRERMLSGDSTLLPIPCRTCREFHIKMDRHQSTEECRD